MNKIKVIQGDITKLKVDAIVNAANTSLLGGGGVDGAIHRAGGREILDECRKIVARQGGCKVGEGVITTAGNLPAKYVIHTVGPVWTGGTNNESKKLESCYTRSMELAVVHQCKTIAFPGISTGIYRFPKEEAAVIAIKAIRKFFASDDSIEEVILVSFDAASFDILKKELEKAGE